MQLSSDEETQSAHYGIHHSVLIKNIRSRTTIFLARHGQSEWNCQKRVSGQLNPPLSLKGVQQSHLLAGVLRHQKISAIYTSTLDRAIETARPTATLHHLPIQTRDELKELHCGHIQGRFRDERDPEVRALWEKRKRNEQFFRLPGGETFAELANRVLPCVNNILKNNEGGTVLIVGHRNTNHVIFGSLMQWPVDRWCNFKHRSKHLYEIHVGDTPATWTICFNGPSQGIRQESLIM